MRVFMLGWEFPPFISGGLGTACYGLTRGLDRLGVEVQFVLPRPVARGESTHVKILSPSSPQVREALQTAAAAAVAGRSAVRASETFRHTLFHEIESSLQPYSRPSRMLAPGETVELSREVLREGAEVSSAEWNALRRANRPAQAQDVLAAPASIAVDASGPGADYSGDLFSEIERYAALATAVARGQDFDVIHAHDWMTFQAGIVVARVTGKPLIVHVHSTEFDRSGMHVNQRIYDIERAGVHAAARVIAVSHLTRNVLVKRYGVDPRKIDVVYNAVDEDGRDEDAFELPPIERDEKIVLYLGRITMQKGPEYFLHAARRVIEVMDNVRFVMAGGGDMTRRMIELAAELGIAHKVLFTGFLRGNDVKRVYRMADLYIMPSVSEPFGITPLEALANDVPVIISKQSGVAEVLTHALKVDFWDIDEMANKIVAVLRHPPLHMTLRDHGSIEVRRFSWKHAAANCLAVYRKAAPAA